MIHELHAAATPGYGWKAVSQKDHISLEIAGHHIIQDNYLSLVENKVPVSGCGC